MSDFQEFLENSLQQKIKQLIPLTGGASADINRIILANDDELIVRRTLSQEKSVMAIPKILEAKIQKVVKKNGAPDFCSLRKRIWARARERYVFPNSTGFSLIPNLFQSTTHP